MEIPYSRVLKEYVRLGGGLNCFGLPCENSITKPVSNSLAYQMMLNDHRMETGRSCPVRMIKGIEYYRLGE